MSRWGGLTMLGLTLITASQVCHASSIRTTYSPGCSHVDGAQHVKWHAGSDLYEMFVPGDQSTYKIFGDASDLSCMTISASSGACKPCEFKMDHIQLMNKGSCHVVLKKQLSDVKDYPFDIDNGMGLAGFGTYGYPVTISCSSIDSKTARKVSSHYVRQSLSSTGCPKNTNIVTGCIPAANKVNVKFEGMTGNTYEMSVPVGTQYNAGTDCPEIGCWGPEALLANSPSKCIQCSDKFTSAQIVGSDSKCDMTLTSQPYLGDAVDFKLSSADGQKQIPDAGYLSLITCHFNSKVQQADSSPSPTTFEVSTVSSASPTPVAPSSHSLSLAKPDLSDHGSNLQKRHDFALYCDTKTWTFYCTKEFGFYCDSQGAVRWTAPKPDEACKTECSCINIAPKSGCLVNIIGTSQCLRSVDGKEVSQGVDEDIVKPE